MFLPLDSLGISLVERSSTSCSEEFSGGAGGEGRVLCGEIVLRKIRYKQHRPLYTIVFYLLAFEALDVRVPRHAHFTRYAQLVAEMCALQAASNICNDQVNV